MAEPYIFQGCRASPEAMLLALKSASSLKSKNMSILLRNEEQLRKALDRVPDWKKEGEFIHRDFVFQNFCEAFSFMTAVALEAEKQGHHPDWQNVYNRLSVRLSTHDAGGLTQKDIDLAESIDRLFTSLERSL